VSIAGKAVSAIHPELNRTTGRYESYVFPNEQWGWIGYPEGHAFSYVLTPDFNPNVIKHSLTVNYKGAMNVYVGADQVFHKEPTLVEGEDVLLPFEQTQEELRKKLNASVIERDGVSYVSANALVSLGLAKDVKKEENRLIITPHYNGENLILPDTGVITQVTEIRASHMEIVAREENGSTVYHVTGDKGNKSDVIGVHILLNEAIKKYGTGNYKISFKAKSKGLEQIKIAVGYGSEATVHKSNNVNIGSDWLECSMEFNVSNVVLNQAQIRLTITGSWVEVDEFDLKDICLVKLS
jgi:hypothetical protein